MKGLLLKDFLVITKQLKLFLLLIPVMALTGGTSMAAVAILLGAVLPMSAIAFDEQSHWLELAVMMPYSRSALVLSKYLLGYLGMAGAAGVFMLVQLAVSAVNGAPVSRAVFMLCFAILSGLLLLAINTPILLRFGSQKGRLVFILFMGLSAAVGSLIKGCLPAVGGVPLLVTLLVGAVLLNVGSIALSMRIRLT